MTIYLDHAATTPLDSDVQATMEPYVAIEFGNPSSVHRSGQKARMAVDEAREKVASVIRAEASEIVFTSGGTESDNAAVRGAVEAVARGRRHVVTSAIEHEAVLETCRRLEARGDAAVSYVLPAGDGIVSVETVAREIDEHTVLVSVMHANNEIGAIQPVEEIGRLCRDQAILFHVDAVQTTGMVPIDVDAMGVDLLSMSAHKFYGPKGVGALYVRKGIAWSPQQLGGGQERLRRSGTENVPAIVGLGAALEKAEAGQFEHTARITEMRDYLIAALTSPQGWGILNGSEARRLPGNVNVFFPGLSGEAMVMALDQEGLLASSGSACASGSTEPSHVVLAIGRSRSEAQASIRLTVGRENTWEEIRDAAIIIAQTAGRLRSGEPAAVG